MNQINARVKSNQNVCQLIKEYQNGNKREQQQASNGLWLHYQDWVAKLVGAIAKKKHGADKNELTSEACIAFFRSVKKYDLSRASECSLKTHASYWIKGALYHYAKQSMHNGYIVPRCLASLRNRIFEYAEDRQSISYSNIEKLSDEFDIQIRRVLELEVFFCSSENINWDDWEKCATHDVNESFCQHDKDKMKAILDSFMTHQTETASTILRERWFEDKRTSYGKLEERLDHSSYKIQKIEAASYNELKRQLTDTTLAL